MKIRQYCPKGCFNFSVTGPSEEHIKENVLREHDSENCPICGSKIIEEKEEK